MTVNVHCSQLGFVLWPEPRSHTMRYNVIVANWVLYSGRNFSAFAN